MSLSQTEMQEKYLDKVLNGNVYEKFKKVIARPAITGEKITTITSDGKETENTAKDEDILVQNTTGAKELYLISNTTFKKRYAPTISDIVKKETIDGKEYEWKEYQPTGTFQGIEWEDDTLEFIAPWNELTIIKKGDMLGTADGKELYRIAKKEFEETYKLKD